MLLGANVATGASPGTVASAPALEAKEKRQANGCVRLPRVRQLWMGCRLGANADEETNAGGQLWMPLS